MTERLRVGVVGVGAIGRHHARIYSQLHDVELVGIIDTDPGRAAEVAERHGVQACGTLDHLLREIDAVSIAVPTPEHHRVGSHCLRAGVDVLLEKPITNTLEEADDLIRQAEEAGRVLQVGHVERFNPAVEALVERVSSPGFVEIHRLGSFAPRSLEVDVVVDLMIHDLEIVHAIVPGEIEEIRAVGIPVLSDEVDIANARLEMATGCIVNLTASRVSMNRVRKVRVFQPESYLSVDYSEQQVAHFRLDKQGGRPEISAVPVTVQQGEPLVGELRHFVDRVRDRSAPRVDGTAGRQALDTALRIRESMRRGAVG